MRRNGKSYYQSLAIEAALDAGKTVAIVSPESTVVKKRKRHLTSITTIKREEKPLRILSDELAT